MGAGGSLAPAQPCLARRGHAGTASASDVSPWGSAEGNEMPAQGQERTEQVPPAAPAAPGLSGWEAVNARLVQ